MSQILKGLVLTTQIIILFIFSFDIEFMPNYHHRSSRWYLFLPFLIFTGMLGIEFIWGVIVMIMNKKIDYHLIFILGLTYWGLFLMTDKDVFSSSFGFLLSCVVFIWLALHIYKCNRRELGS